MIRILFFVLMITTGGCASAPVSGYIFQDKQAYTRKISNNFDQILEAVKVVLIKNGWGIRSQINPSVYERRSGGEDESRDVLIITKPKYDSKIIYSTKIFLNVFILANAQGAEIEIRYKAKSPAATGLRNDTLCKNLLDQIEKELKDK